MGNIMVAVGWGFKTNNDAFSLKIIIITVDHYVVSL